MKPSQSKPHLFSLFFLPLLSRIATAQATPEPQQLFTLDALSQQQTCVQYCFTTELSGCTTDVLGSAIGCAVNPCTTPFAALDSCYCRGDLQSAAQSFLTSCIKKACTVGDVSINEANADKERALSGVRVTTFRAPGLDRNERPARSLGGGEYEIKIKPSEAGVYYVYPSVRQLGLPAGKLNFLTVIASEEEAG